MEKILHSQVVQLERQLDQYVTMVNIQNRLLADVHRLLEAPPSQHSLSDYAALRTRVGDFLKKQSVADESASDDADDDRGASRFRVASNPPDGGQTARHHLNDKWQDVEAAAASSRTSLHQSQKAHAAGGATSPPSAIVESVSLDVSRRLQTAVVRLLSIWFTHLSDKVSFLLDDPQAKFDAFHQQPTEDSLAAFMDSFQQSSEGVKNILRPVGNTGAAATTGTGRVQLGPQGNPFEVDDRLVNLFAATIRDGYAAVASELSAPAQLQGARETAAPTPQLSGGKLQPEAADPRPAHRVAANSSHEAKSRPPPQILATRLPPSAVHHRVVDEVDEDRLAPPTPQPASRQSRSSSLGCGATPRCSSRQNDSSQVRLAMFGDAAATPSSRRGGGGAGEIPIFESERLAELRKAIRHLELQLSCVASSGRDTGSEAKYYALARKLQKLRSDVVKEQRECDEIQKIEQEKLQQKHEKEEHRRTFRR